MRTVREMLLWRRIVMMSNVVVILRHCIARRWELDGHQVSQNWHIPIWDKMKT